MEPIIMISQEIVNFCAIECRLQQSGELSVARMINAWLYAQDISEDFEWVDGAASFANRAPTVSDVLNLGKLVEPDDNALGFRTVGVQVGYDVKMDWKLVPGQMVNLMENQGNLKPEEFFKEFEECHPFRDGNGRTGVILFNWLNDTLDHPVWAPNFWNDPRRRIGFGA